MKKILCTFGWAMYFATNTIAQNWLPVGAGVGDTREVYALKDFNGNLIAGGDFGAMGTNLKTKRIALWNGTTWQNMGAGFDGQVRALAVFNNELYAAGNFEKDSSGTISYPGRIAKWNGNAWIAVSNDSQTSDVRAMTVFNGKLYITNMRYDNQINTVRPVVSAFDGTNWSDVPGEFKGPLNYNYLFTLGEYKGKLVAAGVFDSVDNIATHRAAIWNGNNWEALSLPVLGRQQFTPTVTGLAGKVFCIKEFQGKLFLGGIIADFVQTQGDTITAPLVSWNDTSWTAYRFDQNIGANIHNLQELNDTLFTIGEYGYYDKNNQLQTVCDAFDANSNPPFRSLNFYHPSTNAAKGYAATILNNRLYVGGKFSYAGSNQVNNIARFDPSLLNTPIKTLNNQTIAIFPNPASDWIKFNLEDSKNVVLFNVFGQQVLQQEIESNPIVSVHQLEQGIYFYRIVTKKGETHLGTISIQH
jgi:hypothetical protein